MDLLVIDCPVKGCAARVFERALSVHLDLAHRWSPKQITAYYDQRHTPPARETLRAQQDAAGDAARRV